MKTATVKNILAIALVVSLCGCSTVLNTAGESTFSCPGMPQGVTCKTPNAVFKSTNGALPTQDSDLPMRGTAAFNSLNERSQRQVQMPEESLIGVRDGAYSQGNVRTPLPVRSQAQVMRIWIAPWVDKNDDLHLPSFLYTEVQTRKWNLGEAEFVGNGVTVPYRVIEQAPGRSNTSAQSVDGAAKAGAAIAQNSSSNSAAGSPQPQDDLNLGD